MLYGQEGLCEGLILPVRVNSQTVRLLMSSDQAQIAQHCNLNSIDCDIVPGLFKGLPIPQSGEMEVRFLRSKNDRKPPLIKTKLAEVNPSLKPISPFELIALCEKYPTWVDLGINDAVVCIVSMVPLEDPNTDSRVVLCLYQNNRGYRILYLDNYDTTWAEPCYGPAGFYLFPGVPSTSVTPTDPTV